MDERWSWKLGAVMYCVNNKVNGDNFEELIEISLSFYRERGIACILKTPEPFNKIPENSPASVGSGMNPVFLYVKSFFLRNLSYLS